MPQITSQRFQQLLQNAPSGVTQESLVQGLQQRGYTIQGMQSTTPTQGNLQGQRLFDSGSPNLTPRDTQEKQYNEGIMAFAPNLIKGAGKFIGEAASGIGQTVSGAASGLVTGIETVGALATGTFTPQRSEQLSQKMARAGLDISGGVMRTAFSPVTAGVEALPDVIQKPLEQNVMKPISEGLSGAFDDTLKTIGVNPQDPTMQKLKEGLALLPAAAGLKGAPKILPKKITDTYSTAKNAALASAAKTVNSIGKATKTGTKTLGEFATSQITGLSPKTLQVLRKSPDIVKKVESGAITLENELGRVVQAINKRKSELSETGKMYERIRTAPGKVVIPKDLLKTKITEAGFKVDGGKITSTTSSIPTGAGLGKLNEIYKLYKNKNIMTTKEMLSLRSKLDDAINFEGRQSGKGAQFNTFLKGVRSEVDKLAKERIPQLKEIDAKYGPEREFLNKISRDIFDNKGQLKENALSTLSNLTGKGKEMKLARIEKALPGIGKNIDVLKALEDVAHATGQKTGTYMRAAGMGASVVSGNPIYLLTQILGHPKLAKSIATKYGSIEQAAQSMYQNASPAVRETLQKAAEKVKKTTDLSKVGKKNKEG